MIDLLHIRQRRGSMRTLVLACTAAMLANIAPVARAATDTVCTVVSGPELKRQSGRIGKIDADHVQLTSADARQGIDLPLADVVWIDCSGGGSANDGSAASGNSRREVRGRQMTVPVGKDNSSDLLLVLRDGEAFRGTPAELKGDAIEWSARHVGTRSLPLKDVVAITRPAGSSGPDASASALTQDELRLANGDVVVGVVTAADGKTVTCQSPDGQAVPVEWSNIRSIRFATPAGATASVPDDADRQFRVRLSDGSVLRCANLTFDGGDTMAITSAGKASTVRAAFVDSIEHLNANVHLLAAIAPATHSYEPFFPRTTSTPGVEPSTISIAAQSTRSFISARPHSRLTWTLDGSAKRFRTRYGIPDGRRSANAVVRVLLDDHVVHERADLTSGTLADAIDVDLTGANTLTLEVDFGGAFDVQDQVYWFEPVLIGR